MFVFVSDLFVQDYVGGGELTTEAIINKTDLPVLKIHSSKVNKRVIDQLSDRHWIFGNFSGVSPTDILHCCKNLEYSVIEYDYKYCKFRLPQKHIAAEGSCTCEEETYGKLVSIFFSNAKSLWFMSEKQREVYYDKFPFLTNSESQVLSSVFSDETLTTILNKNIKDKNNKWLIQKSNSWVKGTEESVKYAKDNNLDYELFSGIKYEEMLEKFSKYKGFVFLPRGADTCPRTVIEAKLLGCDLITNDNVQHADESWFTNSRKDTIDYLKTRGDLFWEKVSSFTRAPKYQENNNEKTHFKIIIPAYNSESWIQKCIQSVLKQNYENYECVISDDISTDNTWNIIQKLNLKNNFTIKQNKVKKYALKNIYDSISKINCNLEDVIIILDGDDWLSNSNVLMTLNKYYCNSNCDLTYGSFSRFPDGSIGQESSPYPQNVIDNNSFRSDKWRASHLKTFKYKLWNKVNISDFCDESGKFYEICYDQAMMLPMLEMAGSSSKYIPEILCIYNVGNPNAVNKTRVEKQYQTMLKIRKKKPYKRFESI